MQHLINEKVYLRQTADSSYHKSNVKLIETSSAFINISEKVNKLQSLLKTRVLHEDMLIYLLGMQPILYQGVVYVSKTKKGLLTQYINI